MTAEGEKRQVHIGTDITVRLHDSLKARARNDGTSVSETIRRALRFYLVEGPRRDR